MLTITATAAERIKRILAEENAEFFSLSLSKRGCSGYAYVMNASKEVDAQSIIFELEGIKVAVPPQDQERLAGVSIDWIRDGLSSRLHVENPQVVNACGCGSSFMFK